MIELNEFEFSAKDCLRICLYFWRNGITNVWIWCYTSVILLFSALTGNENERRIILRFFFLNNNEDLALTWNGNEWIIYLIKIVSLGIALFILNYTMAQYNAFTKNFTNIFQKRKLSFDDQKYYVTTKDESEGSGSLSLFPFARVWKDYYLLYINPFRFVPIPKSAFRSEEDRLRFETEILLPKLKKKPPFWKPFVIFLIFSAILMGTSFVLRSTFDFSNNDIFKTNYIEE
ncbi:MAG: hypothetical protein LBK82_00960 [Planctomycetaceae bacterium]|jgi:hypothetical protein|nr:hypothetical protein [Planctomycetaceae bacterium]